MWLLLWLSDNNNRQLQDLWWPYNASSNDISHVTDHMIMQIKLHPPSLLLSDISSGWVPGWGWVVFSATARPTSFFHRTATPESLWHVEFQSQMELGEIPLQLASLVSLLSCVRPAWLRRRAPGRSPSAGRALREETRLSQHHRGSVSPYTHQANPPLSVGTAINTWRVSQMQNGSSLGLSNSEMKINYYVMRVKWL